MEGYFIPKRYLNCWETVEKDLQRIAKTCPTERGQRICEGFLRDAKRYFGHSDEEKSAVLIDMLEAVQKTDENGYPDIREADYGALCALISGISGLTQEEVYRDIGEESIRRILDAFSSQLKDVLMYIGNAGIRDGSRIDSRNSAMSAAADLLGIPEVIARSYPAERSREDGGAAEGTFMEKALGADPANLTADALDIGEESLIGTDGRAFKNMADLGVLDYICGNIDRHSGNMIYRFDENRKLSGITGIDNSCSFGTAAPREAVQNHLSPPKKLLAAAASTAERVLNLSGEELKKTLSGFDLSTEELDAAALRLQLLQSEIIKGKAYYEAADGPLFLEQNHLRIIPDDAFSRLSPQEIRKIDDLGDYENTFSNACYAVRIMREEYEKTFCHPLSSSAPTFGLRSE